MAPELVVVGCSWGGLAALRELLAPLPRSLRAAVAVAQHRGADSTHGMLAAVLRARIALPVEEAEDKLPIRPGRVYLAPPDYHLLVEPDSFALSVDELVQFSRPSIDVLFESAADSFGERAIAVVLTGANADGAAGVARIRARGGLTLAQDPAEAERAEMPAAAIATGAVERVLSLGAIAGLLAERCAGAAGVEAA